MSSHTINKGFLDVDHGHRLYWEEWGNPKGVPVISLHGGPGSGFNEKHKLMFDPAIHHVIFHDQRGSGKSTPFASTEYNTTPDLLKDIEQLYKHFGLEAAHVVGGSWASALSLLFAIHRPEKVKSLLIWGVYLIRQLEHDWVNEGYPRYHFPNEWQRFISLVPQRHRKNGKSIMRYYAGKMRSSDAHEAKHYAIEWTLWESTLFSINYDPKELEKEVANDPNALAIALLETHYFMNGCFVPRNYILNNIDTIAHIPCQVVQGRFDMCTPAISASDLAAAYGDNLQLQWVNAGHSRSDPEMSAALRAKAKMLR